MKQVIIIHGGDTFETYDEYLSFLKNFEVDISYFKKKGWKNSFQEKVGNDFEVIAPKMPNKENAKYLEWKIWFEKILPQLNNELILIGHSLGGIFLAKYLSENKLSKKVVATLLVAAPFDSSDAEYTLADFVLPDDLTLFEEQGGSIILYHSKDDPVVPFVDLNKYIAKLKAARAVVFEDRGHFNQENFPEIVLDIKNISG